MLAQQLDAKIKAVEIEEQAFNQCQANFTESPFANKLNVERIDIQLFEVESDKKFDVIISNPPFFANHLKTTQSNQNKARHDTALTIEQLLESVRKLLSEDGSFFVLLPFNENKLLLELAEEINLFETKRLEIYNQEGKAIFRVVSELEFGSKANQSNTEKLVIRESLGACSEKFVDLLKDYYLYL